MLIGQIKTKRAYMNTEYMNTFHAEFVEMFIICLHKKNLTYPICPNARQLESKMTPPNKICLQRKNIFI